MIRIATAPPREPTADEVQALAAEIRRQYPREELERAAHKLGMSRIELSLHIARGELIEAAALSQKES